MALVPGPGQRLGHLFQGRDHRRGQSKEVGAEGDRQHDAEAQLGATRLPGHDDALVQRAIDFVGPGQGVAEHHLPQPSRMLQGEILGDDSAVGQREEVRLRDAQLVEQAGEVIGLARQRIALLVRALGLALAAHVQQQNAEVRREVAKLRGPGYRAHGQAIEDGDGLAPLAVEFVVILDVAEINVGHGGPSLPWLW
jgi:hypothetical protein